MPRISTLQLTDTRIQRAPIKRFPDTYPEGHAKAGQPHPQAGEPFQYYLWDSAVHGFGVRVTVKGSKTFCYKFIAPTGEQAWMPLGDYAAPVLPADEKAKKTYQSPLDLAREKARGYRRQVADGKDPRNEKRMAAEIPTMEKFAVTFLEEQKERLKPSSYRAAESLLNDLVVPIMGKFRVPDVRRFHIEELHKKIGKGWRPGMNLTEKPKKATPVRANRMLANLRKLFEVAEGKGLRPQGTNPCRGIIKNSESKGKTRFLTLEELGWLGQVLKDARFWPLEGRGIGPRQFPESVIGVDAHGLAAIRLLLATGARLNEILCLKWSQVNKERKVLLIEDHKTIGHSGVKELPINSAVADVLSELEKLPTKHLNSQWVIQGHKHGEHLVNLQKAWTRIREAVGPFSEGKVDLKAVRLHDLRHTHASWGVMSGLNLPQVGNLLGHTQPSTTQRYSHFDTDPRLEASELISSKINAALGF